MYVVATHEYAAAADLRFLELLPQVMFWIALLVWTLTFMGIWVQLLHPHPRPSPE